MHAHEDALQHSSDAGCYTPGTILCWKVVAGDRGFEIEVVAWYSQVEVEPLRNGVQLKHVE